MYKSPIVTDKENNIIEFKFFHNFPCRCAEIDVKDNLFELKIDKSKLTVADNGE